MADLILTQDDNAVIVLLASGAGCSLDSSPNSNWVERSGGLPNYICKIAKAVMRSGRGKSQAIAIAVSRVKKWAAGGDNVNADTRAKAAKALAEWEALKAKNKAKKVVKASREHDDAEYLMFSNITSYNTDIVRSAWDAIQRERRRSYDAEHPEDRDSGEVRPYSGFSHAWITELWTDFIVVNSEEADGIKYIKVPYTVNTENVVSFGDPVRIERSWVEVDDGLNEDEMELLSDILLSRDDSHVGRLTRLAATLRA